jgi:hypothetical protein
VIPEIKEDKENKTSSGCSIEEALVTHHSELAPYLSLLATQDSFGPRPAANLSGVLTLALIDHLIRT